MNLKGIKSYYAAYSTGSFKVRFQLIAVLLTTSPKLQPGVDVLKMFYLDSKKLDVLLSKQKCMVLNSDPRSSQFRRLILLTLVKYSKGRAYQTGIVST